MIVKKDTIGNVKLEIKEEVRIGRNSELVCKENENLINKIKKCLTKELEVEIINRKKKGKVTVGINAKSLNKALRKSLAQVEKIHFETTVENGAFFERQAKSNFDFSFYNTEENYCKLWNYCRVRVDRNKLINESIKKMDEITWNEFIKRNMPSKHKDMIYNGEYESTIVGEIQFGNWAMIYKDMFRLIRAKSSPGVSLYIYITDTGELKEKLSDQIVNFKKARDEFLEFIDVIETPILLIGLDIERLY